MYVCRVVSTNIHNKYITINTHKASMEKYELAQLRRALPSGSYGEIQKRLKKRKKEYSYQHIVQVMNGRGVNIDILNSAIELANEYITTKSQIHEIARKNVEPARSGKRKARPAA